MLKSDRQHPAIQALHDNLTAIGILGTAPWLPRMLSKIPGAIGSYSHFAEWCSRELLAKRVVSCCKSHGVYHLPLLTQT